MPLASKDIGALLASAEQVFRSSKSTVYRAKWNNNTVAIKEIPRRFCVTDRVSLELSAMQKLQGCDNVVRLIDAAENEDNVYIIMEWISGLNSKDYIRFRERPLTESDVRNIVYQVATVLRSCNRLNLIYGDIKPENVMVENSGRVKLIDFGCTRTINSVKRCYMGTPAYFPPEMFDRVFIPQHDVWGLGMLAYYLACGGHPFVSGTPEDFDLLKRSVLDVPLRFAHAVWKEWSDEGKGLIADMLEKDPFRRTSIGEVCAHRWLETATASYDLLP